MPISVGTVAPELKSDSHPKVLGVATGLGWVLENVS